MAVNANGLAAFADAKAVFGYDDTEQATVERLINIASAKIEVFTKRQLAARTATLYLDGNGRDALIVPEWPINSVTTLHVDELRTFGSDTLIAAADYYIDAERGIIQLYDDIFSSIGQVRVVKLVGNFGYATTHLHYSVLNAACLEYVDWLKSRYASRALIGVKSNFTADGMNTSYETEMPLHVREMLRSFVRCV